MNSRVILELFGANLTELGFYWLEVMLVPLLYCLILPPKYLLTEICAFTWLYGWILVFTPMSDLAIALSAIQVSSLMLIRYGDVTLEELKNFTNFFSIFITIIAIIAFNFYLLEINFFIKVEDYTLKLLLAFCLVFFIPPQLAQYSVLWYIFLFFIGTLICPYHGEVFITIFIQLPPLFAVYYWPTSKL